MVEQHIYVKILPAKLEVNLPANESKPLSEFKKKTLNMLRQFLLNFSFPSRHIRPEKVKQIRVLEYLANKIGICRRQS